MTLRSCVSCAALALLLGFADASAQEAQISFRATPFNGPSATPLFKVVVDSLKNATPALPSVTVVETPLGPRISNVALTMPRMTLDPLVQIETMTAYIVRVSKGDLPTDSLEYRTIFAVGLALFIITISLNIVAQWFVSRMREKYE